MGLCIWGNSLVFVHYSDPHEHLRIRFNGDHERLVREELPLITETFNPVLASGRIWKVQFDTYERKIERYGGAEGNSSGGHGRFGSNDALA